NPRVAPDQLPRGAPLRHTDRVLSGPGRRHVAVRSLRLARRRERARSARRLRGRDRSPPRRRRPAAPTRLRGPRLGSREPHARALPRDVRGARDLARGMTGMRIAFLLQRFPVVSETFLLTEMRGLQRAGHVVDVVSHHRPRPGEPVHEEVARSGLLERTHYVDAALTPDSLDPE